MRLSSTASAGVVEGEDDADESLAAEGYEDAGAGLGVEAAELVGEGAVERDRERDVAEQTHRIKDSRRSCAFRDSPLLHAHRVADAKCPSHMRLPAPLEGSGF
jgi:hypothetical protein